MRPDELELAGPRLIRLEAPPDRYCGQPRPRSGSLSTPVAIFTITEAGSMSFEKHPMDAYFADDGLFVRGAGMAYRPGQHEMAKAVFDIMVTEQTSLMVEAPTGTGKTYGYLVPAVKMVAANASRRVAVVVLANALLDQIACDMKRLLPLLGHDVTWSVLKGRSNYLCPERLNRSSRGQSRDSQAVVLTDQEKRQLGEALSSFECGSWDGLLDSGPEMTDTVKRLVTIEASGCKSARNRQNDPCSLDDPEDPCPFFRARHDAANAQIVVTNIDLFVINQRTGGKIFGDFDAVVLDEAHLVHDKVRDSYLERHTQSLYQRVEKRLVELSKKLPTKDGQHPKPHEDPGSVSYCGEWVATCASELFAALRSYAIKRSNTASDEEGNPKEALEVLLEHDSFMMPEITGKAHRLMDAASLVPAMASAMSLSKDDEANEDLFAVSEKTAKLIDSLSGRRKSYAVWVETTEKNKTSVCSVPVYVNETIRGLFHTTIRGSLRTVIAVSATLAIGGSFDYSARQLSMGDARMLAVDSPFPLGRMAFYKLPSVTKCASSGSERDRYNANVSKDVAELVRATDGRALVLVTAKRDMDVAIRCVSGLGYRVLAQDKMPKGEIARSFKEDKTSVLVGMKTYGTGFDVPGESLECVVIWRLPFPKQTPIDQWIQKYRDDGSWYGTEYQPRMLFELRQQIGRLIRRSSDRGIVAICDPRWHTGPLARTIQRVIPKDAERLSSIAEVESFLERVKR